MATRKKAKSTRRASPKKAKKMPGKRGKSTRRAAVTRAAAKAKAKQRPAPKRAKRAIAKRRAAPKPIAPIQTLIVDTVEEPVPGMVVVTETEYRMQRLKE